MRRSRSTSQAKRMILMNRRSGRPGATSPARRSTKRERPNGPIDPWLLLVVVTLVMIGLMVVYAATYHRGISHLKWQLIRAGVGLLALLIGTRLRFAVLAGRLGRSLLVATLGVLVVTIVLGKSVGVATRWLGFIQPAEVAKFVLPMWLAAYFADLKSRPSSEWNFRKSVVTPGAVVLAVLVLTLLQPAIGTTVIIAASAGALFFVAGVKFKYLVPIGIVVVLLVAATVKFHPYAQKRIRDFMTGDRYQQRQSLIAIGSGGPVGKGLGEGKQKFYFLPKLHTDFIVAAVGEEFGFIGSLGIFLLFGGFLIGGMAIGLRANSYFGQYLASGIVITIFMYALIHVAVALGLLPPTGQPLPFISFGGSALVSNLFAAGVLLSISRYRRRPDENSNGRGWNRRSRVSRAGARG